MDAFTCADEAVDTSPTSAALFFFALHLDLKSAPEIFHSCSRNDQTLHLFFKWIHGFMDSSVISPADTKGNFRKAGM